MHTINCLQNVADATINMLIATRSVIIKNQELINKDPITGVSTFKGFVPALVGSQVANDYSLMTGHRLKQTSLKIRNHYNAPDEWEKKVLKSMGLPEYPKNVGYGEYQEKDGHEIYRYMKPIYVEKECLQCHANKEDTAPAIRRFLERAYPDDDAFGYNEGDFRGGISIVIALEHLVTNK